MPRRERPLDVTAGELSQFAADLRALRTSAGSPTYRELSRRAHYSAGTLSDAAGGRKLPTLAVTLAYVRACGADPVDWEGRWHAVAAELAAYTRETPCAEEQAPYLGSRSYWVDDTAWFFGRERLVEDLLAKLGQHRLVAVFGPSGAGKSSFLRAGLLARVDRGVVVVPGPHPLVNCPRSGWAR